jgi:four helix bundle protein
VFDHEKLDVYQLELDFIRWTTKLLLEIKLDHQPLCREVVDQVDRASLSALLNTAEGNGRRSTKQRAKFFDDARGSTTECAAGLDAIVAKGVCRAERIAEGKLMLERIVAMLTKLVARFEDKPPGEQAF